MPVFVVGANRSGTTLLRLILNAHSTLAVPEELNYFASFNLARAFENWFDPGLSEAEYRRFVDTVVARCVPLLPGLTVEDARTAILDGPRDLRHPYATLLSAWAATQGKAEWGEKTPGNLYQAHLLMQMFPEARFLHLVRDPRAGVASMQRVDFFPDDVVFNAFNRHKCMTEGRTWFERHVPAAQRMDVRYEDLVTTPEATVRRIAAFLEMDYEPGMLAFHREARHYMKDAAATSFNAAATRPISSTKTETWRRQLTGQQVACIEHICQSDMDAFGYAPSGERLTWRSRWTVAWKGAYWRIHRWRNREVRQYTLQHRPFDGWRERWAHWTHPGGGAQPMESAT